MRNVICAVLSLSAISACAEQPALLEVEDAEGYSIDERDYVDVGQFPAEPVEKILNGEVVTGAGANGQWEGIVQLDTVSGRCSGFFITDRHILTAGHCFDEQGSQTVGVRAPTWDNNAWHTQTMFVNRQGDSRSIDIAIAQFASPPAWATSARRFRLYTGSTEVGTNLSIYGYGVVNDSGSGGGTLRTGNDRKQIRLASHDDGWFKARAHTARICKGDSGGPAMREGDLAIVWGVAHSVNLDANDEYCPSHENDMTWTKINYNIDYIERALGFDCSRFTGDGQNYARCW